MDSKAQREYQAAVDQQWADLPLSWHINAARASSGLTQAQVAASMGTTRSVVARLENLAGEHSPSVRTLEKYADAVGCRLLIRFIPKERRTRDDRVEGGG